MSLGDTFDTIIDDICHYLLFEDILIVNFMHRRVKLT